ncbi:hypothetical protein E8E13_001192 [Curvularia kusanoi]|uniref:Uncharacterized protein n=1 Tax=Curvularia kusanoi TaxID=90978 RepID=A0A9P4TAQ7_CURKU|nr:hypothetical protein E8E13_001192 [Curvularia kusanoi]
MLQRVSCVERIKDVRLQGVDDEAKIIVTVERSFTGNGVRIAAGTDKVESKGQAEDQAEDVHGFLEGHTRDEWDKVLIKEERNLVFIKAKSAAELKSIQAGELLEPRYLKAPSEPDFSHSLRPDRALLFRYSAITYNAHLLHLDTAYARDVEGHRHLLVHGPLTLTMMLLSLRKHLQNVTSANRRERVESIEYRNLAPLYCDEKMRLCVKNKKRTDTESLWDVWIEGPTGGMAVKAVVRCVNRVASFQSNVVHEDVKTVSHLKKEAKRAQEARPLAYLYHRSSPLVAWAAYKPERSSKSSSSANNQMRDGTAAPLGVYGRRWRLRQVGDKLSYLYFQSISPLINKNEVDRAPVQGESAQSSPVTQSPGEDQQAAQAVPSLSEQPTHRTEGGAETAHEGKQRGKRLVIKKIPGFHIRQHDPVGLEDAARRRGPRKPGQ